MVQIPRDRKTQVRYGLIVLGAIVAFVLYELFFPEIDPEAVLEAVSDTLGQWTYLIVAFLAFGETGAFIGLVFPGETAVIIAGAVAGQGVTDVILTLAIVWASAYLGDTASFFLGRKLGHDFILRHGPKVRITEARFQQVQHYFDRHGGKTILIGRFIGLVRALAPFIAGSSGMTYRGFAPYSVLGTGLWATTFTLLGYFLSRNIDQATKVAGQGILAFGFLIALFVGGYVAARFFREAENREKVVAGMESRRALRPLVLLGRRIKPQAIFLWNRVTPGGLGLELTTLIAVMAVSSFVVLGYISIFEADPGPTPGDRLSFDIAESLRATWLVDVAKVVTWLGSALVVLPLAALAAGYFVFRGWIGDAVVLVVGAAAIALIVTPELKELVGRPRPEGSLVDTESGSFPSGHAANAVIYTYLGVILTYRQSRGVAGGSLLILIGVLITGLVGSTRIYLGAHWGSDVGGGFAEAAFVYALLGAVALIVSHLRNNPSG